MTTFYVAPDVKAQSARLGTKSRPASYSDMRGAKFQSQVKPGDEVVLLAGVFRADGPLRWRSGGTENSPVRIHGMFGAVIRGPAYGSLLNKQDELWHMLSLRAPYVTVGEIELDGAPYNGVNVEASNCLLSDLHIHHAGLSLDPHSPGGSGVLVTGAGTGTYGTMLNIHDCAEHGWYFAGAVDDAVLEDSTITHCAYLLDGSPKGGQGGAGVQINGTGGGSKRCKTLRNVISGNSRQGIIAGVMEDCDIAGNIIFGNNGPQVIIGGAASRNRIVGNQVASNRAACFTFFEQASSGPSEANVFADNIAYCMVEKDDAGELCIPVRMELARNLAESARNQFRAVNSNICALSKVGLLNMAGWRKLVNDVTSMEGQPTGIDPRLQEFIDGKVPI